ncbi:MAG: hypothetical protein IT429_14170 [Gemmataceae bacterium]|nr:hypothetical protein [Gemmataceae bacterium]
MIGVKNPRFALGHIVATPGAIELLERAGLTALELIARHVQGDFGEVDAEDRQANEDAIKHGERILSSYTLRTGDTIWVITEADRSSSVVLRPEDY